MCSAGTRLWATTHQPLSTSSSGRFAKRLERRITSSVSVDGLCAILSANPRYALIGVLEWRELDGDWVVFCSASGALACVDVVGAALLGWLEDGPASAQDLTAKLCEAAGSLLPADADVGVADRLQHWEQAGWVEPLDG